MGRRSAAVAVGVVALAAPAWGTNGRAQEAEPLRYDASWTAEPPAVDGSLEDEAWASAPWTESFVDIRGGGHPQPRFGTRAKLLWDGGHLYVAAEMEEPHLWATLTERDAIVYRDDDFEVFLDPGGDGRRYFELEINPWGTVLDLFLERPYREGGRADLSWDAAGLQAVVGIHGTLNDPSDEDRGWVVEMAIPWADLVPPDAEDPGSPPRAGDLWRINFSRVEWPLEVRDGAYVKAAVPSRELSHPEDNWVWSPQGQVNMHIPARWGIVRFLGPRGEGGAS